MCGIVGYLNREKDPSVLEAMLHMVRHRGPEHNATFTTDVVGLGHARLSIIDLAGGNQPIPNEDETCWIICNGEVYDYRTVRENLIAKGHRFRTGSDSEVVLHLYEEYGVEGFAQLNGQYAFAIWDGNRQQLVLCRDRVGICPMYYTFVGNRFYFASEMKSLLAVPEVDAELDYVALEAIWTMWASTPGRTPFKRIREMLPAHYAVLKPGGSELHLARYWSLDFTPKAWKWDDAVAAFDSLLDDSVRVRLQADVPVGAYLSGGLDSSMTTAYGRRHANTLHTFSITFADPDYDEGPHQRRVAEFFGTNHHITHSDGERLAAAVPAMVYHAEMPQLRAGPISMFLLSDLVRENKFKVVITGEGSDEFLAGYDIFREAGIRRFMAKNPDSVMRRALTRRLYTYWPNREKMQKGIELSMTSDLANPDDPLFSHRQRWQNTAKLQMYFTPEIRAQFNPAAIREDVLRYLPADFNRWHWLAQAQTLEVQTFMSSYLLTSQGDRMAMGHAVEGRFPFLDHRLIDLVNSFPPSFKLRSLTRDKHILRHLAEKVLPAEVANRPKVPYRAPIRDIVQAQAFRAFEDVFSTDALKETGLFVPEAAQKLLKKVQTAPVVGEMDLMAVFGIVTTQLWHQIFVRRRALSYEAI